MRVCSLQSYAASLRYQINNNNLSNKYLPLLQLVTCWSIRSSRLEWWRISKSEQSWDVVLCPSFVLGIRNILPLLLAFLFMGTMAREWGRNSLPVWTANKHGAQCHPNPANRVDRSHSTNVTFGLGRAIHFMLSSYLWLVQEALTGFDIYSPNSCSLTVLKGLLLPGNVMWSPIYYTGFIFILMSSILNICTKYLKFQKWTLFCVTPLLSRSARMHIWAGIPSGKHVHPNLAQICWWKPPHLPQLREFLPEIFAFLF